MNNWINYSKLAWTIYMNEMRNAYLCKIDFLATCLDSINLFKFKSAKVPFILIFLYCKNLKNVIKLL